MNQLTIRGFDDDLSASVRRLAKREGISLNEAALRLLRKGAGLADNSGGDGVVGSSLDHLIGSWTPAEANDVDSALEEFETIDETAWRREFSSIPMLTPRSCVDTIKSSNSCVLPKRFCSQS
ncbi:MAG: hypothetical protein OXC95_02650 [Dehalococcoidia bacterium]|nr:hypothetical protein [Dehalococcoidia bacterium]